MPAFFYRHLSLVLPRRLGWRLRPLVPEDLAAMLSRDVLENVPPDPGLPL